MTGKNKRNSPAPDPSDEEDGSKTGPKSLPARSSSPRRTKSVKFDIEHLPGPIQSNVDKNQYRLIRLPNGIHALLISNKNDSEDRGVPHWHHRTASCLGEDDCTPCLGDPSSPAFNCTGAPNPLQQRPQQMLTHRKMSMGLIQPQEQQFLPFHHNEEICHAFSEEFSEMINIGECGKNSCKQFARKGNSGVSQAAVCLTVNVGSGNDPKDHFGLAHFTEHMVHYGSKEHPGEGTYFNLVLNKGGGGNAFTQCMSTTYHFTIEESYLDDGLGIFSGMMDSPNFDADCIKREVHAVDNEFALKEHLDIMAQFHILSSTSKQNHPLNTFPCGNLETLLHPKDPKGLKKLQTALRNFHEKHYVGSAMTLAIQSSDSLDDLEELVLHHFSGIKRGDQSIRKDMIIPDQLKNPYNTSEFRRMYFIKSRQSHDRLVLTWALPPGAWQNYKSKPIELLEVLLGDEWEYGLSYELRQRGWIVDIHVGAPSCEVFRNEYATLMTISLLLSENAVERLPEIIETVYSHLKRLEELPIQDKKNLWDELVDSSTTYFRYSGPGSPTDLTVQASRLLQTQNGKNIFANNSGLLCEYDDDAILECLRAMIPRNMNVMVFTSSKTTKTNFDKVEEFTKAEYYSTEINTKYLHKWENAKPHKDFEIPENPYLLRCVNAKIRCLDTIEESEIAKTQKYKIDHRGHSGKSLHKAACTISLFNSTVKMLRLTNLKLTLLVQCLKRVMLPICSAIERAGMNVRIFQRKNSIQIWFEGFMETLGTAVEDVLLSLFRRLEKGDSLFTEEDFNIVKSFTMNCCKDHLGCGKQLIQEVVEELIILECPSSSNDLEIIESIDYRSLVSFFELIKCSSFAHVTVEGNASILDCHAVQSVLDRMDFFPVVGMWQTSLVKPHTIFLPIETRCIRISSDTRSERNSYIMNLYQFSNEKEYDIPSILKFLGKRMSAPSFQILRTEQQLGYMVDLQVITEFLKTPVMCVTIAFPSSKRTACFVNQAIDGFFLSFYDRLLNQPMSDATFREQKKLWMLPPHLTLESIRSWYEKTFLMHIIPKVGEEGFGVWNSSEPWKIAKISLQVLGVRHEQCDRHDNCLNSLRTKSTKTNPIHFTCDPAGSKRPYFIDDIQDFRNKSYF